MPPTITSEQLTVAGVGAELRRNYHLNPGAEGTTLPIESAVAATVGRSTTPAGSMPASGAAFFTLTATATSVATARTNLTGRPACVAGQVWAARVTGRNAAAATRTVQLGLRFYDTAPGATAGSTLLLLSTTVEAAAGADWSLELGGIAPAGALSLGLEISRNATGSIGDVLQFDQLQLELLPAGGLLGGYFDGDRADTAEALYSWAGAQYDTASVLHAPARASTTPALMLQLVSSRPARSTSTPLPGAEADYVNLQPAGLRRGRHRLLYDIAAGGTAGAEADSEHAEQLLASGGTFALTYPERPTIEMRFAVLGDVVRTLANDRRRWLIDFDYVQLPA